ncbi:hypothetical protein RFN58_39150 [Streptomyces iakyrus]|uniref:hypothetical protein n=1 Tax=Streptomyces iakyrus TaxID=68219 RepID=UPI000AB7A422|nr:hypothetical protein [Streptomyces iakyrus]
MRRRHHPRGRSRRRHLAKLEAHALLTALLARVRRFEIGKPEFIVNNTLPGLSKLPCRIVT